MSVEPGVTMTFAHLIALVAVRSALASVMSAGALMTSELFAGMGAGARARIADPVASVRRRSEVFARDLVVLTMECLTLIADAMTGRSVVRSRPAASSRMMTHQAGGSLSAAAADFRMERSAIPGGRTRTGKKVSGRLGL